MASLLEFARPGDQVLVQDLSRVGRNALDALQLLEYLRAQSIGLKVLTLGVIDGPISALICGVLLSVHQLERDQLAAKTTEGLRAAKARGAVLGRPASLSVSQRALIARLAADGVESGEITAMIGGVSQRSVQRVLADGRRESASELNEVVQ